MRAETLPVEPARVPVFDPDNPLAGDHGMIAYPNVPMVSELVGAKLASQAYEANLAVLKAADEMLGELMDSIL